MEKSSKNTYRQKIGAWGEDLAANYLIAQGLEIITRNFHTREGEIDIIAQENGTLVFVEVKTRATLEKGYPEEAVTQTKLDHLYKAADKFVLEHPEFADWRMDVIAIVGKPEANSPEIEWYKDANR